MRHTRILMLLLVAVTAPILAGCMEIQRVPRLDLMMARESYQAWNNHERARIARVINDRIVGKSAAARSDQEVTFDVLILSGGGELGAFGAGFLRGWRSPAEMGDLDSVIEFDLVTGVSTGAMIAPFAFIAKDHLLELAEKHQNMSEGFAIEMSRSQGRIVNLYAEAEEQGFAVLRDLFFFLPWRASFYDSSRLERALHREIDSEMTKMIKKGAANNRLLLVGTTDLNLGEFRVWDITALASGTISPSLPGYTAVASTQEQRSARRSSSKPGPLPSRNSPSPTIESEQNGESNVTSESEYEHLIPHVLRASAAIPGAFEPVRLLGHLHADGGAMEQLFLGADRGIIEKIEFSEAGRRVTIRFWVIINNKLHPNLATFSPSWIPVAKRSIETLVTSSMLYSLRDLASFAEDFARAHQEVKVEFRYVAIPDPFPIRDSRKLFNKELILQLVNLGQHMGVNHERYWNSIDEIPGMYRGKDAATRTVTSERFVVGMSDRERTDTRPLPAGN